MSETALQPSSPKMTTLVAIVVAGVTAAASAFLVWLNLLFAALTCGDDGPVDYGTAGGTVKSYCGAMSDGLYVWIDRYGYVLSLAASAVIGTPLIVTGRRLWLYVAGALVAALGAWPLFLIFAT